MKILVLSDIHANLDALERVIEEAGRLGPAMLVCLGDVVGYGANPRECIRMIDSHADVKICGNHDLAAAGVQDYANFNSVASISIEWTSHALEAGDIALLKGYEPTRSMEDCLFTHASPVDPLGWEYIYTMSRARYVMDHVAERIVFVGHTHIPGVISFDADGAGRVEHDRVVRLEPDRRYLVNSGSVGQPRDGIDAASFSMLDLDENTLSMHRTSYDVVRAQSRIRAEGLPEVLAGRLTRAR